MKKVTDLHYHRNGISGLGFYVAIVKEDGRDMLVIRFPKEADRQTGNVVCAAFDLELLEKRDIVFGSNSYRGDHYATLMDKAIEVRERKRT